jgi:dynactin complex subunit
LSEWWHSNAQHIERLQEDNRQLTEQVATLQGRIETLKDQLSSRRPSDAEEVKQSSRELAAELQEFIVQYRENRPERKYKPELMRVQTQEQKREIQAKEYEETTALFLEKRAEYELRFRGRALSIIEAAIRLG